MTNSSEFFKKLKKVDGGYQITLDDGSVIVGSQISDIIRQMMKKSNDEPSFKKISLPDNLKYFVPRHQIKTMASSDEFEDIANELSEIFEMMPKTYEQDGKGDNAKVYLHYFYGDSHWYIIEKDSEKEQLQMFGYAVLNGDLENAELGYISFDELNENNVELDFHFDIDTLGNIKKELNQRYTYARGGKLKKYDYVPNRNIESLELTKGNKTVDVDGADVIDGVYVKKGKYAKGGGVGEEKEYVVTLQHLDSGELIKFNVMGTNEDNAIDNAYMETDLNQPYEFYSVKKMANGGGVGEIKVGDLVRWKKDKNVTQVVDDITKDWSEWEKVIGAKVISRDKKGRPIFDKYAKGGGVGKGYKGVRISHYKVGNKIFIDYMDAMEYCDENNISYDEIINTKEYARGGMSEHGLKTGDKITGRSGSTGVKLYNKNRKESGVVNLDKGIRKTKSYGKSEPTIVRGFVDDEPYEYGKGGGVGDYKKGDKFLISKNGQNKTIILMENAKKDRFVRFVTLNEIGERIYDEPMLMDYDEFEDSIVKKYAKGGSMYSRNASKSKNIVKKPIKKKKKKEPTIVRGFVDDEPYEFKKGGSIHSSLMDDFFN